MVAFHWSGHASDRPVEVLNMTDKAVRYFFVVANGAAGLQFANYGDAEEYAQHLARRRPGSVVQVMSTMAVFLGVSG